MNSTDPLSVLLHNYDSSDISYIWIASNGYTSFKHVPGGDYIPFLDGIMLPTKYKIDQVTSFDTSVYVKLDDFEYGGLTIFIDEHTKKITKLLVDNNMQCDFVIGLDESTVSYVWLCELRQDLKDLTVGNGLKKHLTDVHFEFFNDNYPELLI